MAGNWTIRSKISELGFRRHDALVLDTLDVVAIWQGSLFPWVG